MCHNAILRHLHVCLAAMLFQDVSEKCLCCRTHVLGQGALIVFTVLPGCYPQWQSIVSSLVLAWVQISSKQLRDDLMTMLIAGHETTAAVLTWTVYCLTSHPQVVARVHKEVSATNGSLPHCSACTAQVLWVFHLIDLTPCTHLHHLQLLALNCLYSITHYVACYCQ